MRLPKAIRINTRLIKATRKSKKITQQEISDLMAVSRTAYCEFENNNGRFTKEHLNHLLQILELKESDVITKQKFIVEWTDPLTADDTNKLAVR